MDDDRGFAINCPVSMSPHEVLWAKQFKQARWYQLGGLLPSGDRSATSVLHSASGTVWLLRSSGSSQPPMIKLSRSNRPPAMRDDTLLTTSILKPRTYRKNTALKALFSVVSPGVDSLGIGEIRGDEPSFSGEASI